MTSFDGTWTNVRRADLRGPDPQAILADLTPNQADAARRRGAVLVLAGAGTGKTKTLTAGVALRIAERGMPGYRVLAVTFTNKAAGEMRERIAALLVGRPAPSWIGTFHGLGARQLRAEPQLAGLRDGFDILDADDARRLLKRTLKTMELGDLEADAGYGRDAVKAIGNLIGRYKDNLIVPEQAAMRVEAMIAGATAMDFVAVRLAARVYQGAGVRSRPPAGLGRGRFPECPRRSGGRTQARLCRAHPRQGSRDRQSCRVPPRLHPAFALPRGYPGGEPAQGLAASVAQGRRTAAARGADAGFHACP